MADRQEFSTKIRVAAFDRCRGLCEKCGAKLTVGKFDYDHRIPWELTRDSSLDNCHVICAGCHRRKTSTEDIPRISKAKRQRASFIGAKKKTSRPFPFSKSSPLKKKIDGSIVPRK